MVENILIVKGNMDKVYLAPSMQNEDEDDVDISVELEHFEIDQI